MVDAFQIMYGRLTDFLIENIDLRRVFVILEAGCGSGQLTMPFTKSVMKVKEGFKVIALALSAGPYEGDLDILKDRIQKDRLGQFITAVKGDVRKMDVIENGSVDLIVSNELFGDLDRKGLENALQEFYRILKLNGQMAHGELIPVAENDAQKLLIEADAHCVETSIPRPDWFSPFSDEVAALMHKIGFKNIVVKYFETNVRLDSNIATQKLKDWKVDPAFIQRITEDIRRYGIEFPIEHIIFCEK